jgi:hypothetical protein
MSEFIEDKRVVQKTKKVKSTLTTKKLLIIEDEEESSNPQVQPFFKTQVERKDVLANMIANTKLGGIQLFELLMENNLGSSDSRRGDLFETICEILVILKCITGLNYTKIMIW